MKSTLFNIQSEDEILEPYSLLGMITVTLYTLVPVPLFSLLCPFLYLCCLGFLFYNFLFKGLQMCL